jgi:hypothetical protein
MLTHSVRGGVYGDLCPAMWFHTWDEIALFSKEREKWLRKWLLLPGGGSSHDTFNRIFALLPPETLKTIFQEWIYDIIDNDKIAGQLAIDGKALRGAAKGRGGKTIHRVNVWSTEQGMCIGQQKVGEKTN